MGIGGGSAPDVKPRRAPGHDRGVRPLSAPETDGQGWWKSPREAREEWFREWARRNGVVLIGVLAAAGALLAFGVPAKRQYDEARIREMNALIERCVADPTRTECPEPTAVDAFRDYIIDPYVGCDRIWDDVDETCVPNPTPTCPR